MKKSFVKVCAVMAIAVVASLPVLAKDWVQIGFGHYIDIDSVKPTSSYGAYTFTTKYTAKDTPLEIINGKKIWTIKTNSYIDCRSAYGKTISYTAYDEDDKIVASDRYIHKQWLNLTSGGRGTESYDYICTDKYLRKYPGYRELWLY